MAIPTTNGAQRVADHAVPLPRTQTLVRRPRLLTLIDHPTVAPVTLITAPAGFGKSTLAAHWAHLARHPVAWVTLVPESNSLARFLATLHGAIAGALPDGGPPPAEEVTVGAIAALLQTGADAQRGKILILDDYHQIENRDVHQAMDALLARLPADVHLLVLSRTIPPLSLGRLRVQGLVRELTEADLRFAPAEVAAVVATAAAGRITPDQVARLTDRTGGWIAAIRLALLSITNVDAEQIDPLIESFAENQWLDDYIVEEVINALSDEVRDFVLRTASLGSLHPELCDAVLEIDHSAGHIDDVASRLVFARRDGRGGASLTYHALFADCVARIALRYLPAGDIRDQHRRAAPWCEQHGQPEAAVKHALKGEDLEAAVRLTKPILRELMNADWAHSAVYWLRKLPKSAVVADPDLAYWYIWSHFLIGRAREARQVLDRVERDWMASGNPLHQGRAVACRIYSRMLLGEGGSPELQDLRLQALALVPEDNAVERMHLWSGIYVQESLHGSDETADDAFRQAGACADRLPSEQNFWIAIHTFQRPEQVACRGQLPVAIAMYERALSQLPARLRYLEASVRHRLAAIHLERGDLDKALAEAALYEPDLTTLRWEAWHPEAWMTSAQLRRAAGDTETAYEVLDRAMTSTEVAGITHVAFHARALQASWWLADGEPELAVAWEQSTAAEQLVWGRTYGLMNGHLTLIQLRAAEGDNAAASAIARNLIAEGEQLKRWAEVIPFYAWEAWSQFHLGDREAALAALCTALRLGMPGGFVRSFTPVGADMHPLFAWAIPHVPTEEAAYLQRLLHGGSSSSPDPDQRPHRVYEPAPAEPLSPREVEVLDLIHQGLTNREIADRLFVSERTVKKHVGNILAKLHVRNRTFAAIRAMELGLLK